MGASEPSTIRTRVRDKLSIVHNHQEFVCERFYGGRGGPWNRPCCGFIDQVPYDFGDVIAYDSRVRRNEKGSKE